MFRSCRAQIVVLVLGLSLLGCSASSAGPAPTATAFTPPTSTVAPPTNTVCVLPETPIPAESSAVDTVFVPSADADLAAPTCIAGKADSLPVPTQADPSPTADATALSDWLPDGTIGDREYLDQHEIVGLSFYWRTDGKYLYGALSAETTGWVAVGFDPENMMKGANYVFGYVQGGETYIQDMFGVKLFGSNSHPPDAELGGHNDIVAYGGREEDGVTTIEFQIPLDSGDAYDKVLDPGKHTIIVALGTRDDFTSRHASRDSGTFVIGE